MSTPKKKKGKQATRPNPSEPRASASVLDTAKRAAARARNAGVLENGIFQRVRERAWELCQDEFSPDELKPLLLLLLAARRLALAERRQASAEEGSLDQAALEKYLGT